MAGSSSTWTGQWRTADATRQRKAAAQRLSAAVHGRHGAAAAKQRRSATRHEPRQPTRTAQHGQAEAAQLVHVRAAQSRPDAPSAVSPRGAMERARRPRTAGHARYTVPCTNFKARVKTNLLDLCLIPLHQCKLGTSTFHPEPKHDTATT
jgi:hypothetical protein